MQLDRSGRLKSGLWLGWRAWRVVLWLQGAFWPSGATCGHPLRPCPCLPVPLDQMFAWRWGDPSHNICRWLTRVALGWTSAGPHA